MVSDLEHQMRRGLTILEACVAKLGRMEWALEAFLSGDREVLQEILVRDPRTRSVEQAEAALEAILSLHFNQEMKEHYS